jgi:hypothetical protein
MRRSYLTWVVATATAIGLGGCGKATEESAFKGPATPAQAATILDLSTFPVMEGVPVTGASKGVASLAYQAPAGDVKSVFEFQRKNFVSLGWKELPNSSVTAEAASAMFAKKGFVVSVSAYPTGEDKKVSVFIQNLGNIKPGTLPLPDKVKPIYVGDPTAIHVTDAGPDATKEAVRRLFTDQGWVPYGGAGDSVCYKQNAILVTATVVPAPAHGGKTTISYSTELMSADLPAPDAANEIRYTETHDHELNFTTAKDQNAIVDFYKKALGANGWQPTLEHTVEISGKQEMIFRNPGKDMITLAMPPVRDGTQMVSVQFMSAAEVADMDRYVKEHGNEIRARIAKEKSEEEKESKQTSNAERPTPNAELPKVAVALPTGISELRAKKDEVKFTVHHGKAKGVVETLAKQLTGSGWKQDVSSLDAMAGAVSLSKDGGQGLTITYTDTGVMPSEVEISAISAELELKK